ncbi:MAG: putative DNA-binding transcriptional regulator [Bacteroidales bacterium]|nr:DDE transposase family protein [Bacteroidales bacterium]MCR5555813.1 putative DNA-binding transcriptional regulator [Bacteroidales bacterium]
MTLTIEQKKDYAKQLFLNDPGITQAEIAEKVGVSKVTICKWVKDGKWQELQASLLIGKEEQLARLYKQLRLLNDAIENKQDQKFATSKEADAILKLTVAIKNLETETNIAEKMATGKEFLAFVRKTSGFELSKDVAKLFNAYIKSCL